jgi:hypothetical protein
VTHRDLTGTPIVTDDRVRFGEEPGEGTVKSHAYDSNEVLVHWDGAAQPEWEDAHYLIIIGNWSGRV